MKNIIFAGFICFALSACKKSPEAIIPTPPEIGIANIEVDGFNNGTNYSGVSTLPIVKVSFTSAVNRLSVSGAVAFKNASGVNISYNLSYADNDSTIVLVPASKLDYLSKNGVTISTNLTSKENGLFKANAFINLLTIIDSSNKFPIVTNEQLLTLVQRQHFKYFWDFGHPVSGLARERNTSGDVVTSGGSGFGLMAIITGISRGFITKAQGLARMQKITTFLKNKAQKFHGAFPHWLNGVTGQVIPFSQFDDGADLVETSYLVQGLLTARQFFNGSSTAEQNLRNSINSICNNVEWDWFRKNNEQVLYWHWSQTNNWNMNVQIKGWNECLITYVLAASSSSHSVPKTVYDQGWASNGGLVNGKTYYGVQLPLGPAAGGPLFFAHYSFLGIDPTDLVDAYANYKTQNAAHTQINFNYCKANPQGYYGYSVSCWGLTASDDFKFGYKVHEPNNDNGVISPTAALSSFPYTPVQSMNALNFFYYKLGDKLFKEYGFTDAFSLNEPWFADSFLAIDQGPIIIMIENYRSGLLWDLFMSCPEVKTGMRSLGFTGPHL